MDSLRHDLRALLDEVGPEITGVSATADECPHPRRGLLAWKCQKCGSFPAPGRKLRYCGLCKAPAYCGKACARAGRAEHNLECDSLRRTHSDALAAHEARGGRKKDFRKNSRDSEGWFLEVPGLLNQIGLLAWTKHRQEAPLIYVSTPRSDGDGSGIRVEVILRSVWAEGSRFVVAVPDSYPELLIKIK
jgi:hypothetical protein